MPTLLITHPCFTGHDTGLGHPERPDRMRAIDKVLAHETFDALKRAEAPLRADVEEHIARAHPPSYIDAIRQARPSAGHIHLDPDTVMSPGSWEAALRAVSAGLEAVDQVMDKSSGVRNAFCQVRPCGHHAESQRAMGFCLFNNIAIAGLYARAPRGGAHCSGRLRCPPRQRHPGNFLVGQGPVLRLDPPDAALSRNRSAR